MTCFTRAMIVTTSTLGTQIFGAHFAKGIIRQDARSTILFRFAKVGWKVVPTAPNTSLCWVGQDTAIQVAKAFKATNILIAGGTHLNSSLQTFILLQYCSNIWQVTSQGLIQHEWIDVTTTILNENEYGRRHVDLCCL